MSRRVIARIKGGLGNQLFCYAAARRLAIINGAELALDDVSGFARDYKYRRQYILDRFGICGRRASPAERFEPFERYRRTLAKWASRRRAFESRRYIEQEGTGFDPRLLNVVVSGAVYLDGYWQSEGYFKDVESYIRNDFEIEPPDDAPNQRMATEIQDSVAVGIHVRWFDQPGSSAMRNVSDSYYRRAIAFMEATVRSPRYFVFSDNPEAVRGRLGFPEDRVVVVAHNQEARAAYADLWLMRRCQHFIIANSTFSWWGAWLGAASDKIVIAPAPAAKQGTLSSWYGASLVPPEWIRV